MAIGCDALYNNTTGSFNVANGYAALSANTTGIRNTAVGETALGSNTTGSDNAAFGLEALLKNTTGGSNTAIGFGAMTSNTTGSYNAASGNEALYANTTGTQNLADGFNALYNNTTGGSNTASGYQALYSNVTGSNNTALGTQALYYTTGSNNTAFGYLAGIDTTGTGNLFFGFKAGANVGGGSNNIEISSFGSSGDSGVIRIGDNSDHNSAYIGGIYGVTASGGAAVYINSSGQLGTATSSARYKQDIHDMDKASDALYALRPVGFRYKPEYDPAGLPQFGLVAEEVEKVAPELVIHGKDGLPYSVRYEQVNAMLLNEFLKEHARMKEQASALSKLEAAYAEQATATKAQQEINAGRKRSSLPKRRRS